MDPGVDRETEQQRQEREAKQKADADTTAMEPPQPPRPISEQSFSSICSLWRKIGGEIRNNKTNSCKIWPDKLE
jgi:hypothetical protein